LKILSKAVTADVQITTNACYLVGASSGLEVEHLKIYDEGDGTKTAARLVMDLAGTDSFTLPMPGIKCDSGLYADIDHGTAVVYYYF